MTNAFMSPTIEVGDGDLQARDVTFRRFYGWGFCYRKAEGRSLQLHRPRRIVSSCYGRPALRELPRVRAGPTMWMEFLQDFAGDAALVPRPVGVRDDDRLFGALAGQQHGVALVCPLEGELDRLPPIKLAVVLPEPRTSKRALNARARRLPCSTGAIASSRPHTTRDSAVIRGRRATSERVSALATTVACAA